MLMCTTHRHSSKESAEGMQASQPNTWHRCVCVCARWRKTWISQRLQCIYSVLKAHAHYNDYLHQMAYRTHLHYSEAWNLKQVEVLGRLCLHWAETFISTQSIQMFTATVTKRIGTGLQNDICCMPPLWGNSSVQQKIETVSEQTCPSGESDEDDSMGSVPTMRRATGNDLGGRNGIYALSR